jgi:uncharacterized membrane protein (DUF485 family)
MSLAARPKPVQAVPEPAHVDAAQILESPEFKRLVRSRWRVSTTLLVLLFASYYGYILLVALRKDLLATKIGAVTTLGIPLGIATLAFAWLLTAVYVGWANRCYDPEVERLRKQVRS